MPTLPRLRASYALILPGSDLFDGQDGGIEGSAKIVQPVVLVLSSLQDKQMIKEPGKPNRPALILPPPDRCPKVFRGCQVRGLIFDI